MCQGKIKQTAIFIASSVFLTVPLIGAWQAMSHSEMKRHNLHFHLPPPVNTLTALFSWRTLFLQIRDFHPVVSLLLVLKLNQPDLLSG